MGTRIGRVQYNKRKEKLKKNKIYKEEKYNVIQYAQMWLYLMLYSNKMMERK